MFLQTEPCFKSIAFISAVPPFYVWIDLLGLGYSMTTMVVVSFANIPILLAYYRKFCISSFEV